MAKQAHICLVIERNQNVDIAVISILSSGKRAEQPCFYYWLPR